MTESFRVSTGRKMLFLGGSFLPFAGVVGILVQLGTMSPADRQAMSRMTAIEWGLYFLAFLWFGIFFAAYTFGVLRYRVTLTDKSIVCFDKGKERAVPLDSIVAIGMKKTRSGPYNTRHYHLELSSSDKEDPPLQIQFELLTREEQKRLFDVLKQQLGQRLEVDWAKLHLSAT